MNATITTPLWLAVVIALFLLLAGIGASALIYGLVVGFRSSRLLRDDAPAEPVAVPEPAVQPAPVEVVVMHRQPDLLPPLAPRADEVPMFAQVPIPLPAYISTSFHWDRPADLFATGSFPEIEREMADDSVVPPVQLPGFEIDERPRKRFEVAVTSAALREAAEQLSKRAAKVKAEVSA